eukprot:19023-Eustigmatos_ZCMA.PRE.1
MEQLCAFLNEVVPSPTEKWTMGRGGVYLSIEPSHPRPCDRPRPRIRPADVVHRTGLPEHLITLYESPRIYTANHRLPPEVRRAVLRGDPVPELWRPQLYSMFAYILVRTN